MIGIFLRENKAMLIVIIVIVIPAVLLVGLFGHMLYTNVFRTVSATGLVIVFFFIKRSYSKKRRLEAERRWQAKLRSERMRLLNPGIAFKMNGTIKLTGFQGESDAYYSNEFVRITFRLEDIFPETLEDYPVYAGFEAIPEFKESRNKYLAKKKGKRSDETFACYLPDILESGMVKVVSKVTLEPVNEIRKQDWGFSVGPLMGAKGFGYALPDGTMFYKVTTVVN
jgi:hypothetical protein